ncbi:hypothetical protein RB195_004062 [Necator americanus]|uniref:Uncharacterized protein n=1 Tax=Necator americanus TaxID=51031 RepID=A0ABR1BG45_NECAM
MESLSANIHFVTLNRRTLSSELDLSRLLPYLCVLFVALQETRILRRLVISIENNTTYCDHADEKKVVRLHDICEERLQRLDEGN